MSGESISLGLGVDSSGVVEGTQNLTKLSGAAQAAQAAANGLSNATKSMSSGAAQAAQAAASAATATTQQSTAATLAANSATLATAAVNALIMANVKATQATQAMTASLQTQTQAANQNVQSLNNASRAGNQLITVQKGVGSQAGIIGAQFQDIGVQLAGGQSPFLIAMQQGTQLSFLLQMMQGQGLGVGASLAAAFKSILSPLSLITIAAIAAFGYLIQYFTQADEAAAKTDAIFEKHAQTVKTLADRWGDLIPSLKEYNDQLQRTIDLQKLREEIDNRTVDAQERARAATQKFGDENAGFIVGPLSSSRPDPLPGEPVTALHNLAKNYFDLIERVNTGRARLKDFEEVSASLSKAIEETQSPMVRQFAENFQKLAGEIIPVLGLLDKFIEESKKVTSPTFIGDPNRKVLDPRTSLIQDTSKFWIDENGRQRNSDEFMPNFNSEVPLPARRPTPFEIQDDLKDPFGGADEGIDKTNEAYKGLLQSQNMVLDKLKLEANLVGASAKERAILVAQFEAETKARQANVNLTQAQIEYLKKEAAATAELRLKVDQMQQGWKTVQDAGMSAIDQLTASIGDLDTSAEQLAKNLANTLLEPLKELAIANPLKNAIYGTNLPTMESIGGFKGFFDALSGKKAPPLAAMPNTTTGTMVVTAGTVTVTGPLAGGMLPGGVPVPGFNAVRPDLTNSGLVNSPTPAGQIVKTALDPANVNANVTAGLGVTPGLNASTIAGINQQKIGSPLDFVGNYKNGVDPRLTDILNQAALRSGYKVEAFSGYRPGDPRFHGKGLATDISLIDPATGQKLPNYQNAGTFRQYEQFAQTARQVQMEKYPELADDFRWGGYFSGKSGKYGAMDQQHFDLGGQKLGMKGGTWEGGLTDKQRALWPNATSIGMDKSTSVAPSRSMEMYQQAISQIESGSFAGDYSRMGPVTRSGDQAYGRYQVMGNNIPSWSQKWYGEKLTPNQFLENPKAQDAVFNGQFGSYVDKYGENGAAAKWLTGRSSITGRMDMNGTTDTSYIKQFQDNLSKLGNVSNTTASSMTNLNKDTGSLAGGFTNLFSSLQSGPSSSGGGFFSFLGSLFGGTSPAGPVSNQAASLDKAKASLAHAPTPIQQSSIVNAKLRISTAIDKTGNIKALVRQESKGAVEEHVPGYIKAYDENHLPGRVKQISTDEHAVG